MEVNTFVDTQGCVDLILEKANSQIKPLKSNEFEKFFEAMSSVWQVCDKYDLPEGFTSFLMFGPQSAGKTTLTERILGFPVGRVKSGIGTTRPMVLTTKKSKTEAYEVWTKNSATKTFTPKDKHLIMDWVCEQMRPGSSDGTVITSDPIYVKVAGPRYKNRRFVDLPGFQQNGVGTRDAIRGILEKELKNPNAVVVCVEDCWQDFANSNLVSAIKQVIDKNFASRRDLRSRFVICLNKSDGWFSQGNIGAKEFIEKWNEYTKGCGLVPILVGNSINTGNKKLRHSETTDRKGAFLELEKENQDSDDREIAANSKFFGGLKLPSELEHCLANNFRGFRCLLGTIDALVVGRDKRNLRDYAEQLKKFSDQARVSIVNCENEHRIIANVQAEASQSMKQLLRYLQEIATADFGHASAIIADDLDDIRKHGYDAKTEEIRFAFGKQLPESKNKVFNGYYRPNAEYVLSDDSDISIPSEKDKEKWADMIYNTITMFANKDGMRSISYIDQPLIGGIVYERAIAVWSVSVYKLVAPSLDDLMRLPNTMGTDPEMQDPEQLRFKKAKRLAEGYIRRLTPSIHYLCQKIEFLLLHVFDTAWRGILKTRKTKTTIEAIGEVQFKTEVRARFAEAIKKRAAEAFEKCISDLENEVGKLFPYTESRASVAGLLSAFPTLVEDMQASKRNFDSTIAGKVKQMVADMFPKGFPGALLSGVEEGVGILAKCGFVDPVMFMGLCVVKTILEVCVKEIAKRKHNRIGNLAEENDEKLLGVAACLYAHFVPRFVTTIDARMRREMWEFVKHPRLSTELETWLVTSDVMTSAAHKGKAVDRKMADLKERAAALDEAYKTVLDALDIDIPCDEFFEDESPFPEDAEGLADYDDAMSMAVTFGLVDLPDEKLKEPSSTSRLQASDFGSIGQKDKFETQTVGSSSDDDYLANELSEDQFDDMGPTNYN